ncbi:MAG: family 10 glycosylhydrolase [Anaerolineae bacterium]
MNSDIPEFWRRPFRMVRFDLRLIDAQDVNPRDLVASVVEFGGNVLWINALGAVAWYPSQVEQVRVHEDLRGDLLSETLGEAHRQGLKALVSLDVATATQEAYARRPDWLQQGPDGTHPSEWGLPLACFEGPAFQELLFTVVDELVARYPVDGLIFDRIRYGHCLCERCRSAFRQVSGLELPTTEDWDSPAWRRYVRYRYDQVSDLVARLTTYVHRRNPRLVVAVGMALAHENPRLLREAGWLGPQMMAGTDIVALHGDDAVQASAPLWPHAAGEQARMARTLDATRPALVLVDYGRAPANRRAARPAAQVIHDMAQTVAHGGQLGLVFSGTLAQDDRKGMADVRRAMHLIRDHAASFEGLVSPARIALLYSQSTLDYYGRDDARAGGLEEYRGFYEMLAEGHRQFDLLHDVALDAVALERYDLLVLPNAAVLSDDQAAVIDAYVQTGGRVLASYETGLYDAEGRLRATPALRCLGRRVVETVDADTGYLRVCDKALLEGFQETDILALAGSFLFTQPLEGASAEGEVSAAPSAAGEQVVDLAFIPPVPNNAPEYAYWVQESDAPGLVLNRFGAGEVAYLPWEPGRLYYRAGTPEVRQVVLALVKRWVSPEVTTGAPASVELSLHHVRGDRNRALVQLVNGTGRQGKPLTEVIPLHDVPVWVRGPWVAAHELVTGQDLALTPRGTGVSLVLPRLDEMAAIELVTAGHSFATT